MTDKELSFIKDEEVYEIKDTLPVLPLRDVVVFPYMVLPLLVGRDSSVAGIEASMLGNRMILLLAQRDGQNEEPGGADLYRVGVIARILQTVRLPDGTLKVLVEGLEKVSVKRFINGREYMKARIEIKPVGDKDSKEIVALMRKALGMFEEYVKLHSRLPEELLAATQHIDNPLRLGYMIAGHLMIRMSDKQDIIEADTLTEHFQLVCQYLRAEMDILKLERKIDENVKKQILKNQREFYLQEQLKAIHKELGNQDDDYDEIHELREQLKKKKLPAEVRSKAEKEINKLSRMSMMSPEATVVRNYLDWIISLPWKEETRDKFSVDKVAKNLDEDHFGLQKPKERIVEYIAVMKLVGELKGPILCFVGPPGVGKTSLGKSIARSLGRKLVRLSLGGVRDEAEIRGHRRTYIGALPGKIIQAMKRAGVSNPVILIDEVDKMNSDFRGDPSSALLEVLDPEQNSQFVDHYLEVDYDLSKVMFITTANYMQMIPAPLRDRMEIITLPGYLTTEKLVIARNYLLPKQLKDHGLKDDQLVITDAAIEQVIQQYTREAGVRSLERELGSICRKVARRIAAGKNRKSPIRVTPAVVKEFLGVPKFLDSELEESNLVGLVNGLAWTGVGGSVLQIEVQPTSGQGRLTLTGKLGDVMKESAEAALTYVRSRFELLGLDESFYRSQDLHIHVPEGATPKDGPSAGVAITTAIVSALTSIPARRDVAMTGEVTLRGRVLPVGGLKEKSVAALRAGIKIIIWPAQNEKDLEDLPDEVKKKLDIRLVNSVDEVLNIALVEQLPKSRERSSVGFISGDKTDSVGSEIRH